MNLGGFRRFSLSLLIYTSLFFPVTKFLSQKNKKNNNNNKEGYIKKAHYNKGEGVTVSLFYVTTFTQH